MRCPPTPRRVRTSPGSPRRSSRAVARRSSARQPSSTGGPIASCRLCSMPRATRITGISPPRRASWWHVSVTTCPTTRWPRSRARPRGCASSSMPSSPSTSSAPTSVQRHRMPPAWRTRRFVDDGAHFKFVPGTGYAAMPGELRFDMFEGEYTHRGDRCTFEVLLMETGLDDPALAAIGEIIHDIDLKDGKYGREEAAGIRNLIAGIASAHNDDNQRLERGGAVLDDLYQYFRSRQPGQ